MTNTAPVALLTGASSGIGYETALLLAQKGFKLTLVARRRDRLEELAARATSLGAPAPQLLAMDLTTPGRVDDMVRDTLAHHGRLDVLINNAGILRMARLEDMPMEESRLIFETNFWSIVRTIQLVAPMMRKQGRGRIVSVGSAVSRRGVPFMASYAASKFALLGLIESLRVEYAQSGVTFGMVLPGGIDTEMPNNMDRSRLPAGYPNRAGYRIGARRAAQAVLQSVLNLSPEIHVPWWITPGLWLSATAPKWADALIQKGYRNVQWKSES